MMIRLFKGRYEVHVTYGLSTGKKQEKVLDGSSALTPAFNTALRNHKRLDAVNIITPISHMQNSGKVSSNFGLLALERL